jgi:hypothetical protein
MRIAILERQDVPGKAASEECLVNRFDSMANAGVASAAVCIASQLSVVRRRAWPLFICDILTTPEQKYFSP